MAEMVTMVDMLLSRDHLTPPDGGGGKLAYLRPASIVATIWRGISGRCPRCACTSLFKSFLKPVGKCVVCGENWQARSSDDFPPYVVILLLGHVIVPGMISLETVAHPALWVHLVIWLPLVAILGAAFIQPVKGGVMALQWWLADAAELAPETLLDLEEPSTKVAGLERNEC